MRAPGDQSGYKSLMALLALLLLAQAPSAAVLDSTPRHEGFVLRADAGAGYVRHSPGPFDSFGGAAASFGVHLGYAVSPNVVVSVHAFELIAPSPKRTIYGSDESQPHSLLAIFGLGPEVSAFAHGFHFSLTIGATWLSTRVGDNGDDPAKTGIGGRVSLGKEWWIGTSWALGAAAQFTVSSNTFLNAGSAITTSGPGLAFTASFH